MRKELIDDLVVSICYGITCFIIGLVVGTSIENSSFIDNNYGKEFVVFQKTIRSDEFHYKIINGNSEHFLSTKDDLDLNSTITIGVRQ